MAVSMQLKTVGTHIKATSSGMTSDLRGLKIPILITIVIQQNKNRNSNKTRTEIQTDTESVTAQTDSVQ